MVRGNVDSLVKLIAAFNEAGIEMIDEGAPVIRGDGVRLKIDSGGEDRSGHAIGKQDIERNQDAGMISAVTIPAVVLQMSCVAGLLAIAALAIVLSRSTSSRQPSTAPHWSLRGALLDPRWLLGTR